MTHLFTPAFTLLVAALLCGAGSSHAAVSDDIRALTAPVKQARRTGLPYAGQDWLQRFYAPRGFAPAWLGPAPAQAQAVIALLQRAAEHGMAPADYHADALAQRLRTAAPSDAALDVDISRAMLHYLADLRVGRIRSEYHPAQADPRLTAFDPVEQLRAALDGRQLADTVARAQPRIPLYKHVQATLAHYRALAGAPAIMLAPLGKGRKIAAGAAYPQAAALRALLQLLGDEPGAAPAGPDALYSAELADAVKRFQARHGLLDDGILGPGTLGALNTPLDTRVRQLELTLERLRWLPDLADGPVIAVNLPAFRLWAFDRATSHGVPVLEMKVIVGTAVKTQTPLFIGQLRYLEFNPYWNVPRSIERNEMIPKLEKNAQYLAQHGMELVPRSGGGAATDLVGAAELDGLRKGRYRVRQKPGPDNALGAVKFAMPNPDDIYLHSTSAQELFQRTRRDLSHGCIRVEKPLELAQFVLASHPDWPPDKVAQAIEPGATRTVNLTTPIPVILFYATAMADRDGKAIFSPDVYRRDPALEQALRAGHTAP